MHRGSNGNKERGHAAEKGEPPIRRKEQREAQGDVRQFSDYDTERTFRGNQRLS